MNNYYKTPNGVDSTTFTNEILSFIGLVQSKKLITNSLQKHLSQALLVITFLLGSIGVKAQVTQTYSFTGADQTFTVPAGVTSIDVKMWGAGGAGCIGPSSGGSGALVKGTLAVTPGQSIIVVVGGGGSAASTTAVANGGFGGGGNAMHGGPGGGYSGLFTSSVSQANALVIAGGGGGGGYYGNSTYGGGGGATAGVNGGNQNANYVAGQGGTLTAGGAGGTAASGVAGSAGSALQGGNGGTSTYNGAGGGGGYYGGGGGYGTTSTSNWAGAAGGGSSYLGALTNITNTAGTTSSSNSVTQAPGSGEAGYVAGVGNGGISTASAGGNGLVLITYILPPCAAPTSLAATVSSSSQTLTTISGSFTAAPVAPTGYLVVRTTTNVQPTPVNATTYTVGSNAIGYIEYVGTTTGSWTSTGLSGGTTYYYWVFSYNSGSCTGPVYSTTATPFSQATSACPGSYSGTMSVGPTGTFTNLTTAITNLTACGYTGNIILELEPAYVSTGETFPLAFGSSLGSSSSKRITIRPASSASNLSITSNNTVATVDLNGAAYITFDGRAGGSGTTKNLTIANTSTATGGTAVRFINDANNNALRYLNLSALYASTTSGVVNFSTTTGANGNDDNTIDNCNIDGGAASNASPTTVAVNGIYSSGSTTSTATNNSGNTISNNNIFNFFGAATTSAGISIQGGNTDWTITGNSIYQTATRTTTSGSVYIYGITIANSSGNNFVVTNNFIGGSTASAGGSPWTVTGAFSQRFNGIGLSVGTTTASSVQGNTIANFSFASTSSASTNSTSAPLGTGVWGGIMVAAGNVNVGNTTANTIGAATGTGSINVTVSSNAGGTANGIGVSGSGTVVVNNNIIGSITTNGGGATISTGITGIISAGTGTVTINGNTIGSTSTANSLNASLASTSSTGQIVTGILNSGSATAISITNNTIANLANAYVPSSAYSSGSVVRGIVSSSGANTITGNTVRNLATAANATGTTSSASVIGISNTSSTAPLTISSNTVYALSSTHASAAAIVTGIYNSGPSGVNNVVAKNFIYGLTTASTASIINGLNVTGGTTTYQNNMIALGSGLTQSAQINGVNETSGTDNFYHNSIFIGGSNVVSGTVNSFAFNSTVTSSTRAFRNNIFSNTRSNTSGTGAHFAIQVGGSAVNPSGLTTNNNILFVNGTGGAVGRFNSTARATIADWRTATGQDANSYDTNPQFVDPTNATPNLHINPSVTTLAEGNGVDVGVADDFDGQTRSGLTPVDIGADAGNFTGVDLLPPSIVYTPLSNTTVGSNQTLTATITDTGSGVATSAPGLPVLYYKIGAGSYNAVTGTSIGSNQYTFTFGAAAVTHNDVVSYYIVAQDLATTPNIAAFPAAGTSGLTATPPASATPPTTPSSYTVLGTVSGVKTVCSSGCDYASLTLAGGAFADINAKIVTGNVELQIADNLTAETGANALNAFASPYTLKMYPTGSARTVSGSLSSNALIKLNGADRVTIDGSIGGTGTDRSLTITNTSTSAPTAISLISTGAGSGATDNTIKNLNISTGVSSSAAYGIAIGGSTPGNSGSDNDNNTIQNNSITVATIGIYAIGNAAVSATGMDNLSVIDNTITTSTSNSTTYGIQLGNSLNSNISKNTLSVTTTGSGTPVALSLETGFVSSTVSRNLIKAAATSSSGGYGGRGIAIGTGTSNSALTLSNNIIYGVNGSNYSGFGNSSSMGIAIGMIGNSTTISTTAGGINLYYNSVYLSGNHAYSSATNTAAIYVGSNASNLDIRNNIFMNSLIDTASSGSKDYGIYSAVANTAFTNIDNNIYFGNPTGNSSFLVGYLGADQATLAAWKTATGKDANSLSADPLFNSATNLAPLSGSPAIAAGTPIGGVTVDFNGITRNVTTPYIGAYEQIIDSTGPVIAYTALDSNCGGGARTLTASITDIGSGVPTSGAGLPVLYWKIGAGTYTASTATFVSGNSYSFSLGAGSASSDVISYYIVAQDNAGTPNVSVFPAAGAAGFSINPPAASTAPTTPSTYTNLPTLSGTYTVGTGGNYATLTAAVAAYNSSCVNGAVTFNLTDTNYSTGETFPITINSNVGASAVNTLTIKPATGVTATISGSSTNSVLKLNGADYIIIDGSNAGSSSKNLTITNTSTNTASGVVCIGSATASDGANNNTIKNTIVTGNSNTTTFMGISVGSTVTIGALPLVNNNSNTITNNTVSKTQIGIGAVGLGTSSLATGLVVSNNTLGSSATGDGFTISGIAAYYHNGALISGNTIQNITNGSQALSDGNSQSIIIGIYLRENQNGSILANRISNINIGGSSAFRTYGISLESPAFNTVGSPSANTVANNVLYDIRYSGTGSSTWQLSGINDNGGYGDKFYYNSVSLTGNFTTTSGPNACFSNGNAGYTSSASNIDVRNNIFYANITAAGTTSNFYGHYNRQSATTGSTLNNNDIFVATTAGTANIGLLNTTAYTTLATWKTATGQEAQTINANPLFTSTTNLHPQIGSPVIGAGTPVAITTDFAGITRNASTPSQGAYEEAADLIGPTITYTALANSCTFGARTLSVTITDATGVSTSGAGLPVLYWKVNSGTYNAAVGTHVSGNQYDFTFGAGTIAGDVVSYYIVAQDTSENFNVTVSPAAGAAGLTSNPPAAATPPTTPNSYLNSISLGGTYTVGAGGNYTTLTAAAAAYNSACLTGAVIFSLTDATYTGETFPISINANVTASATNTLTIKPATGVNATFTAVGESIILNGADYVTIDGSNNGSSSRNLTFVNTDTATGASSNLWLRSVASPADGATNNTIKNVIVTGNSSTTTWAGIEVSGSAGSTPEAPNSNNTIQNNLVTKVQYGIFVKGATGNDVANSVVNNTLGSSVTVDKLGIQGIYLENQQNVTVSTNTITGINTSANATCTGIYVIGTSSGGIIEKNKISDVKNSIAAGRQAFGIHLNSSSTTSGLTLANNMIFDVANSANIATLNRGAHGIAITAGGGYNLYYNTVTINTNPTAANTTGVNAALYVASGVTALDVRNNIFSNSQTTSVNRYAIYSDAANTAFTTIDYNNYSSSGTNLGYIGSARATLANIQTGFGQNTNSTAITPVFVSATDVHLDVSNNSILNGTATVIAGYATDIDGNTRSATTPDVGADEFDVLTCTTTAGGTAALAASSFCTSGSTTLSATGYSIGVGTTYEWEKSTDNFATPVSMGAASSIYAGISTGTVTATTKYRLKVVCSNDPGNPAYSSVVTLTIHTPATITASAASPTICTGASTTLTAGGAVSYTWTSTPSGFTSTSATPSVSPVVTTIYSVVGVDANNCTTSAATTTVTVNQTPTAVTVASSASPVCSGSIVTLTASGGNVPGGNPNQTIYSESFTGSLGTFTSVAGSSSANQDWAYQPNGYSHTVFSTTYTFTGSTGGFALVNSDIGGSGSNTNTQLVSAPFNTTGYTNLSLKFNEYLENPTDTAAAIEISDDNFATSTTLRNDKVTDIGTADAFNATTIAIPSQFENKSNIKIRFRFEGVWDYFWAVDEVRIIGDAPVAASTTWTVSPSATLYTDPAATAGSEYVAGSNALVVYAKPTANSTYTAVATNGTCASASGSATVNVTPLPTFTVSPITICKGETGTLTAVSSESNSYSWTPVGGGTTLSGNPRSVNPLVTTTYNVTATSNTTTPACTSTTQVIVNVSDPGSIISGTTTRTVSPGQVTTFEVVASGNVTYQWQVNDNVSGWQNILAANPDYTGETTNILHISNITTDFDAYQYRCLVTGEAPCTALVPIEGVLNVTNTGFQTQPADVTLCNSSSADFSIAVTGSNPYNFQWQISTDNGGSFTDIVYEDGIDTELVPGVSFIDAETGLTFTNYLLMPDPWSEFPTDTSLKTLSVSGITPAHNGYQFKCQLDFFLDSSIATLTVNTPVTITNNLSTTPVNLCQVANTTNLSIDTNGSVSSVIWKYSTTPNPSDWTAQPSVTNGTPAGVTYTATNPSANHYNLAVGTTSATPVGGYYYKAIVVGTGSGIEKCPDVQSNTASITINNPTVVATPSSASYCTPGTGVTITASGATSYSWAPGAGLNTTTGSTVVATPSTTTTYTVTGTDAIGCSNTATATITVGGAFTVAAANSSAVLCPGSQVSLSSTVTPVGITPYSINTGAYTFSAIDGTFTPLSGATAAPGISATTDDGMSSNITPGAGFTFNYGGTNYTAFRVSSNGQLVFGTSGTQSATNDISSTTSSYRPGLAPLWDDLQPTVGVTYQLSGTSPNRVLTVEWLNMEWNYASDTPVISFQVKLYETTNVIEYIYRQEDTAYNAGTTGGASIGLMGTSGSNYLSLQDVSNNPAVSTTTAKNDISEKPATGQIYRFTPYVTPTYTYAWTSTPSGFTSAVANPTPSPAVATTYNVTVTSPAGCTATSSVLVNVQTTAPTITTQPVETITRCSGGSATLSVTATSSSPMTYQWRRNGAPLTNGTGISGATTSSLSLTGLTTASSGDYDVVITTCTTLSTTSTIAQLTVNPLPTVAITPSSSTFCSPGGTAVALTASGSTANYSWSPSTGLSATTGSTVSASPTATQVYTVTATDSNTCSSTATTTVNVAAKPGIASVTATPSTICNGGNSQLGVNLTASVRNLSYASSTGNTLLTITSPTSVTAFTTGSNDDGFITVSPSSFTFPYAGSNYTTFNVGTNGYVVFGTSTPSSTIPSSLTTHSGFPAVYGFGRDGNLNVNNGGNVTHGTAAGGKYVLQLTKNSGAGSGGQSGTIYATYQIVLWGSTSAQPGKIEIIYGESAGTPSTSGTIGVRDTANNYINGINGSLTSTTTASAWPASGQMYSFSPPTYSWSPATNLSSATAASPQVTGLTGTATYTVTATLGTCTTTGNVTVNVNPLPTASISGTTTVCRNSTAPTVTFTGANGTAPYIFTYKLNGGANQTVTSTGNVATLTVPTATAGVNTYTLVSVQDGSSTTCSQVQSGTATVTVVENITYYRDADGDGYGNPLITLISCNSSEPGYVTNNTDCNDSVFAIHPGATEICFNGIDDNCDNVLSEGCPPALTYILPSFCGTVLANAKSTIGASTATYSGPYAVTYLFKITNLTTNVTVELPRAFRNFNLGMTDIIAYGTSYSVQVAAVINGEQQPYSAPCIITTPSIPTTQLAQCGGTITSMTSSIACNSVSYALGYQFEVAEASNPTVVKEIFRLYNNFSMILANSAPNALPLLYNTEYRVRVKVKVLIDGEEAWGNYSAPCIIRTPLAPEAYMLACAEEGIRPANLSTPVYSNNVAYATMYKFTIYNDLGYSQSVEHTFNSFRLNEFNALSPLTPGATYSVVVDVKLFDHYYPGKDCEIIIPLPSKTSLAEEILGFEAKAYPNPFAENFRIDVKTGSSAAIDIKVYDMVGRLVETRKANVAEMETTTIGERYPSGVYNVVITQGEEVKTLRVVKR